MNKLFTFVPPNANNMQLSRHEQRLLHIIAYSLDNLIVVQQCQVLKW